MKSDFEEMVDRGAEIKRLNRGLDSLLAKTAMLEYRCKEENDLINLSRFKQIRHKIVEIMMDEKKSENKKQTSGFNFSDFVGRFVLNKISSGEIVNIIEDYGVTYFMVDLHNYLSTQDYSQNNAIRNEIYTMISLVYFKGRKYLDEHR